MISHSHRFVVSLPAKTGGTSLLLAWSKYCAGRYKITRNKDGSISDVVQHRPVITKHGRMHAYHRHLSKQQWESYKKISLIRDPYSRFLSHCKWLVNRRTLDGSKAYLHKGVMHVNDDIAEDVLKLHPDGFGYWHIGERYVVDHMIRMEHFDADFITVCNQLGLPAESPPRVNTTKGRKFNVMLSMAMEAKWAEQCELEIDFAHRKFGYPDYKVWFRD